MSFSAKISIIFSIFLILATAGLAILLFSHGDIKGGGLVALVVLGNIYFYKEMKLHIKQTDKKSNIDDDLIIF